MSRSRLSSLVTFFLLAVGASLGAQSAFFTTIGTRDGLPNSSVSAIVQDSRGFLWFGTQGGLVRYDGYTFTLFESEPFETNTLSHNQVQTLFLDDDVLWVGTYGGLNRLDLKTGVFSLFRHDPENAASLSNDVVIAIERDVAGRLWVGTSKGLNLLDESTGTFKRYFHDPQNARSIGSDIIRDIHRDRLGVLWIATSGGGLAVYAPGTDDFARIRSRPGDASSLPSDFVMSIDEAPDGTLWFGCWYAGIARLADRESARFQSIALADDRVYFVDASVSEYVLAGTWGGGLFEIDPATGAVERRRAGDGPGSIASDVLYSAFLDETGVFWIGTNGGGVSLADRRGRNYHAFLHDAERPGSLAAGKVASILEDRRGRLWIGVYNGGLNRWDPQTGRFIHYRRDPAKPRSLPNDIVNFIYETSSGELWIGTNEGLCRYDERTDDFTIFRNDPADPHSLADSIVYAIEEAPNGDLWIGTYTKGLDRFVRESGRFLHYPPDLDGNSGPRDGLVYALEYDAAGNLWLGLNNGLDRMEGERFVHYRYDPADRDGISANTIRNLFQDSSGRLWLGTVGGGLMRYESDSDTFRHFMKKDGLPNNTVRSIVEAADGSIWVGTATGIGVIDPTGTFFRGYSVYNDLKDRDFHIGAWRSQSGELYFGGMNAVYRVSPAYGAVRDQKPRVLVSSITSGGEPIDPELSAAYLERLSLPYQRNDFTVSFAVVDFREPGRNQYSYKLEGFDNDWSPVSTDHVATYTNLPGGSYLLRVRAADSEGYWNEEALALPVFVASPPWRTPPAFALYFALLIGLGYLVASLRGKNELRAKITELIRLQGELEGANRKLADLSLIDGLTGISNRRRLDESLPRLVAEARREKRPLSVLMLDLDYFKDYNDRYGHLKGDEALRSIADILQDSIERASDLVARFGGEEFIAVLPNTDKRGALRVAERIRSRVENAAIPAESPNGASVVTISIGVFAGIPKASAAPEDLIRSADEALYRAKTGGRNRVSV